MIRNDYETPTAQALQGKDAVWVHAGIVWGALFARQILIKKQLTMAGRCLRLRAVNSLILEN
jgi:hypothetical protein